MKPATRWTPAGEAGTAGLPAPLASGPKTLIGDRAMRYLHRIFLGLHEERLHVVFYDAWNRYLHDRTIAVGSTDEISLRARWLLQEAFSLKAHGIVLAHNHLSGVCRPSESDVDSTLRLAALCREVDITLIDHLIFTRHRGFSMRLGGYL